MRLKLVHEISPIFAESKILNKFAIKVNKDKFMFFEFDKAETRFVENVQFDKERKNKVVVRNVNLEGGDSLGKKLFDNGGFACASILCGACGAGLCAAASSDSDKESPLIIKFRYSDAHDLTVILSSFKKEYRFDPKESTGVFPDIL